MPRILLMTRNKCSFHSPNTVLPQEPQSSYCTISLLSSLLEPHPSWCGGDAAHSPAVITLLQRNRVYSPMARKFLPYHFRVFRKETKVDQGIEQELTTSNALQETQGRKKKKEKKRKRRYSAKKMEWSRTVFPPIGTQRAVFQRRHNFISQFGKASSFVSFVG